MTTPKRFVIELEVEEGAGWSATMPDTPTMPREYQGLAALNRTTPTAALRGLADALAEAAELRLADDLAAVAPPSDVVTALFGSAQGTIPMPGADDPAV